jgi:hypothetical protein
MRRYLLGTLIGLCTLGFAAPSGAVPMTDTLFGTVTEIVNPDTALDWVVGTPITVEAEWDTDDELFDLAEFGLSEPGDFFWIPLNDNPRASITITIGSETWTIADQTHYFNPLLLFDAEGDFLGPNFGGVNSNGTIIGTGVASDLLFGRPFGGFRAGSTGPIGVIGFYDVPGWDGNFPIPIPVPVPEPGTLALLSLGLLGLGWTRRRTN